MIKKLSVLKKSLESLKNGFNYNWYDVGSCNCGLILKTCGATQSEILNGLAGSFSDTITNGLDTACDITGLPLSKIQKIFLEYGFTKEDIMNLEFLGNKIVLERMGLSPAYHKDLGLFAHPTDDFSSKVVLVKYLETWIQILEEQEQSENHISEFNTRYILVEIDGKVKDLIAEEKILN